MKRRYQVTASLSMTLGWLTTYLLYNVIVALLGPDSLTGILFVLIYSGIVIFVSWLVAIALPIALVNSKWEPLEKGLSPFFMGLYGMLICLILTTMFIISSFPSLEFFLILLIFMIPGLIIGFFFGMYYRMLIKMQSFIELIQDSILFGVFIFHIPVLLIGLAWLLALQFH